MRLDGWLDHEKFADAVIVGVYTTAIVLCLPLLLPFYLIGRIYLLVTEGQD